MTPTILVALMLTQTEAELSANIEARVRSATVRVVNRTKRTEGAGVVIGRTGPVVYVLTAAHLFEDGERVEAQSYSLDNSPKLTHDFKEVAVVSRKDPMKLDLAILRFAPGPGILETTLAIAGPKELPTRDRFPAFSAACSLNVGFGSRPERVESATALRKADADRAVWFWKCKAIPELGRSGGPLVDSQGRLLGICSGGDGKAGYYVHVDEIREFLKESGLRFVVD